MHCHYNHHFNIMRDTFALFSRSSVCVCVCTDVFVCVWCVQVFCRADI